MLAALCLAACSLLSGRGRSYDSDPGPYDLLRVVSSAQLEEVRRLRDAGEVETAWAYLARLVEREPDNLPLSRLAQDVALEHGGEVARRELYAKAREAALLRPSVPTLLLAARLETDQEAAYEDLADALELEPDSAWVHYALAHHFARAGRWPEAQGRLERALILDGGHLGARRLETLFLARSGSREGAIAALERWVGACADNPFYSAREVDAARMDLAQLYVLDGRPDVARATLGELDGAEGGGARARELLAAVEQAEGRPSEALLAAREAELAGSVGSLPLLQQALLQEESLGDLQAARAAWLRVLEVAGERGDIASVLLRLRARAALERIDAEAGP